MEWQNLPAVQKTSESICYRMFGANQSTTGLHDHQDGLLRSAVQLLNVGVEHGGLGAD